MKSISTCIPPCLVGRPDVRAVGRSVGRPVGQTAGRSVGRSAGRSAVGRTVGRPIGRSVGRTVGRAGPRGDAQWKFDRRALRKKAVAQVAREKKTASDAESSKYMHLILWPCTMPGGGRGPEVCKRTRVPPMPPSLGATHRSGREVKYALRPRGHSFWTCLSGRLQVQVYRPKRGFWLQLHTFASYFTSREGHRHTKDASGPKAQVGSRTPFSIDLPSRTEEQ